MYLILFRCITSGQDIMAETELMEIKREVGNISFTRQNKCDQCEYTGCSKLQLKRHKQSVHEKIRYPCDLCEHLATTPFNLKTHKQSRHEGIRYTCDKCSFTATKISHVRQHEAGLSIFFSKLRVYHVSKKSSCQSFF